MEKTPGERLREAREKRNLTVEKLAQLTGFAISTIRAHQNGQNNIKINAAQIYEEKMNLPEGFIVYGLGEDGAPIENPSESVKPQGVIIRYKVQAGIWEEVFENSSYILQDYGLADFLPDKNIPINDQWAEQVIGDSVNKKFPDGTIIHVRRFDGEHESWPLGKFVVLQHIDGSKRKRTVKYLDLLNGEPTAIGFSTNPQWNKPISFNHDATDDEICYIDGVVIKGMVY